MILNPDIEKRKEVAQKVLANDKYCPCMIVQNEDTKCPCKDKREKDICICGLYIKEEN
jgi:ferredoxin-thioredoxin reductase catalytic subunit